jgi:hypothetical protein
VLVLSLAKKHNHAKIQSSVSLHRPPHQSHLLAPALNPISHLHGFSPWRNKASALRGCPWALFFFSVSSPRTPWSLSQITSAIQSTQFIGGVFNPRPFDYFAVTLPSPPLPSCLGSTLLTLLTCYQTFLLFYSSFAGHQEESTLPRELAA